MIKTKYCFRKPSYDLIIAVAIIIVTKELHEPFMSVNFCVLPWTEWKTLNLREKLLTLVSMECRSDNSCPFFDAVFVFKGVPEEIVEEMREKQEAAKRRRAAGEQVHLSCSERT